MKATRKTRTESAFSLIEVMTAMAVLAALLVMLAGILGPAMKIWGESEQRVEKYQNARASLELMSREMTPAVVDTRMQFAILPGSELPSRLGIDNIVPEAPVALWMAPLGERNRLHCVGYFLIRDEAKAHYRLKRIFVPPTVRNQPDVEHPYYPRMTNEDSDVRVGKNRTSPVDAEWFVGNWDQRAFRDDDPANRDAIVATVADGVVAIWIQCYDLLGNPIPWFSRSSPPHPESGLIYNSAGYFYAATSRPFEDGSTFRFAAEHDLSMKANRVPAEVEIRVYTIDREQLQRGLDVPEMVNVMDGDTLNLDASARRFEEQLLEAGAKKPELFSVRVKLLNGS